MNNPGKKRRTNLPILREIVIMVRSLLRDNNNHKTIRILLYLYPYALYFGMEFMLQIVDSIVGTNVDAGGSSIGWYVGKVFMFAVIGTLCSGIAYPAILKLEQTHDSIIPYMLFVTLNYPAEYLFFSLPLLVLQAENLPVILRTPGFSDLVVILSSLLANYLRKLIARPDRDLRQRVIQEGFVRSVSVFILVLIITMVSLSLKKFI